VVWFARRDEKNVQVPPGLWIKCPQCNEVLYSKEVSKNLKVCTRCNYHFRINARERLDLLIDQGSFVEYDKNLKSVDPLNFKDVKRYKDRLEESEKKTGLKDAIITGEGTIDGHRAVIGVMDFDFMGGSMGSVVGEKVTRAVERATQKKLPLIIVSSSGGARMQESILSLMQMAKTSAALTRLHEERLPYISVLADPTTAGVAASFAMLGDINIAERNALIGFTGPRVIEQTLKIKLPEGFQQADFQLQHGMVDMVVDRKDMKKVLAKILRLLGA
jgi:acetyl-CoA carboxylase carboxyl transferase subunit beta